MKKLLTAALLFAASAQIASAEYQWDIALEAWEATGGLDSLDCWNPETCAPDLAMIYMVNPADPEDLYQGEAAISGPSGQPEAYHFLVTMDDEVPGALAIDSITVDLSGPGFAYHWALAFDPFSQFYIPGPPPVPVLMHVGYGDGCVPGTELYDWTWANFPDGEVPLTDDFHVPEGQLLYIEAGISAFALEGVSVGLDGEILAEGTSDAWITFDGDGWGGIDVGATGDGDMYYTRVTGVVDDQDGGAFYFEEEGHLTLWNCLVDHNSTTGMGGAAYVAEGGQILLRSCTVSDNAASSGGNFYAAGSVSGMYNLVTFGDPECMVTTNPDLPFGNLQFSCVYPIEPDSTENTGWYCNPGYWDAEMADYNISFWSLNDPTEINCVIDVAVIPEDIDPDGTPKDLGAFPFSQYDVLLPATLMSVADMPEDEGGLVVMDFEASPNDGSWINPITFYSVWIMYPGSEDWVSSGQAVGALNDPEMVYTVTVPTMADSMDGAENIHSFMVSAHNSMNPQLVAFSDAMDGWSVDNLAPGPVSGVEFGDWYYDQWEPTQDMLDLSWDVNQANDFAYYQVYAGLTDNIEDAEVIYEGMDTQTTYVEEFGVLDPDDPVYFWFFAVDEHLNNSEVIQETSFYVDVDERVPLTYELGQNYPNPFNPSTKIDYSIAQPGEVSLVIYNLLGEPVATLVDKHMPAGHHGVYFDAGRLASGVYVYQIQSGSFIENRKMVLVK